MLELLCKKLPLSCMLRGLLERCFSSTKLDKLFDRHSEEQYTRNLLFSKTCDLLLQVVLRVHPSAHAAYQSAQEEMTVSASAFYDKLKGIEPRVSAALVRESGRDLAEIQDALGVEPEILLPGYDVRILDGNCIEASEKRLSVHRHTSAAPLPGKSLVVLDPQRNLLIDVFPCEDGHAQERSLFNQVLPTVTAGQLWIADRNFCTCGFLNGLNQHHAFALVRQHAMLPYRAITEWTSPTVTEEGKKISEQSIQIEARHYRRIRVTLVKPTRDGETHIDLITDMPEEIKAHTLAQLYLDRWRIETAFQRLEAHLESEINTLAYPRAALFGFCLAMVSYNIFSITLSALDSAHHAPVSKTVSTYYMSHEIASTFLSLFVLTEGEQWQAIAKCSVQEFAIWLRQTAAAINPKKYKKHSRGTKKTKTKIPYDSKHPHVSTYQLLLKQKQRRSE